MLEKLIDENQGLVSLHMRDKEGLTALAIAAGRGYPDIVLSLLRYGANPNARTRERPKGRSILRYVAEHMQGENDDARFSRMICCANLLADSGAKFEPTEFEEYCMKHVGTAGKTSVEKFIERLTTSEETRNCMETDPMIKKRKLSIPTSQSRRRNLRPQVTSTTKKALEPLLARTARPPQAYGVNNCRQPQEGWVSNPPFSAFMNSDYLREDLGVRTDWPNELDEGSL